MSKVAKFFLITVFIFVSSVYFYSCTLTGQQAKVGESGLLPRAFEGAPPLIPHDVEDEGICLDCHRLGENDAMIVPHPDRFNCVPCHIPQDMSVEPVVENVF